MCEGSTAGAQEGIEDISAISSPTTLHVTNFGLPVGVHFLHFFVILHNFVLLYYFFCFVPIHNPHVISFLI